MVVDVRDFSTENDRGTDKLSLHSRWLLCRGLQKTWATVAIAIIATASSVINTDSAVCYHTV